MRHILARSVLVLGVGAVSVALSFGWQQAQSVVVTEIVFSGVEHADSEQLREMMAVPDSARIFELDPHLLADRAEREPWVRRVRVTRWLTGRLHVDVEERRPVALALEGGRPAAFLDADGHAMPATASALAAGYDVPLLSGHLPRLPLTQPVDDVPLRQLLAALPPAGSFGDALIAAIERAADGSLSLITSPGPGGRPIAARLGRDDFPQKIKRLEAFWEQVVLAREDHGITLIDLRFDDLVVTRETAAPPSSLLTSTSHE